MMKKLILNIDTFVIIPINCLSQFGADYSSYGFNFISETYNDGLKNWVGTT